MVENTFDINQRNCGIKVGDYVWVTRAAGDYENGWGYPWVRQMDALIGKRVRVISMESVWGFIISSSKNYICSAVPYFVCEKDTTLDNKHNLNLDI